MNDDFEKEIAEALARAAVNVDSENRIHDYIDAGYETPSDATHVDPDANDGKPVNDGRVVEFVRDFVRGLANEFMEAPVTTALGFLPTYPGGKSRGLARAAKELGWDHAGWFDFGDGVAGPFATLNKLERDWWKIWTDPDNAKHALRGLGMTARENMERYLDVNTPGGIKR